MYRVEKNCRKLTALAGDPNAGFLGPCVDADADMEVICYRRTSYVLPCYVPECIQPVCVH